MLLLVARFLKRLVSYYACYFPTFIKPSQLERTLDSGFWLVVTGPYTRGPELIPKSIMTKADLIISGWFTSTTLMFSMPVQPAGKAFDNAFLERLDELWKRLPLAPKLRSEIVCWEWG